MDSKNFAPRRFRRVNTYAAVAAMLAISTAAHSQDQIGIVGLKTGMTIEQAQSILSMRNIRTERSPGFGFPVKGELVAFAFSDPTSAARIDAKVAFSELNGKGLDSVLLSAPQEAGLKQFFQWLQEVFVTQDSLEITPGSSIAVSSCISRNLRVSLALRSEGLSTLLYESNPSVIAACHEGPYLHAGAGALYSFATISTPTRSDSLEAQLQGDGARRPAPVLNDSTGSERARTSPAPSRGVYVAKSIQEYRDLLVCFAEETIYRGIMIAKTAKMAEGPYKTTAQTFAQQQLNAGIAFYSIHADASATALGRDGESSRSDFEAAANYVRTYSLPQATDSKTWRKCDRNVVNRICEAIISVNKFDGRCE